MIKKLIISFLIVLGFSCQQRTPEASIQITFNSDSTSIVFLNISKSNLKKIESILDTTDLTDNSGAIVSVFQINDGLAGGYAEELFPGKLKVQEGELVFTPKRPFKQGSSYLVETYIDSSFGTFRDVISGKVGAKPKPNSVELIR